jgi:hypothetical protein
MGDCFIKLEIFWGVLLIGLPIRGDYYWCFKLGVGVAFLFKVFCWLATRVAFSEELTCYYDFKVSAYSTVVLIKLCNIFIWCVLCYLLSAFSLLRSNLFIFSRTLRSICLISLYTCNCFKNYFVSSYERSTPPLSMRSNKQNLWNTLNWLMSSWSLDSCEVSYWKTVKSKFSACFSS